MPWQDGDNTCFAPSIIQIFINMALKPGQANPIHNQEECKDGGVYAMYGAADGTTQADVQKWLLLIAVLMVPIILLPKPLITYYKHKNAANNRREDGAADEQSHHRLIDQDVRVSF